MCVANESYEKISKKQRSGVCFQRVYCTVLCCFRVTVELLNRLRVRERERCEWR